MRQINLLILSIETCPITLPTINTLEYRVYQDLWRKGNYLTMGETFGGNFLVYPGDPLYFHASHILHIVHGPLTVKQMISYGRLSIIVNKFCVFAMENSAKEIVYQHMEWQGNQLIE
jgi:tRNA-splicing endonuclease subunit Sen34